MPSEPGRDAPSSRTLTAWISREARVISFHPVPGFLRLRTRDADAFWLKIRALVEEGWRLQ